MKAGEGAEPDPSQVRLTLKDGRVFEGELLEVDDDRLLIRLRHSGIEIQVALKGTSLERLH